MFDAILQEPFTILLALILIVAVYGLISSERGYKRNSRELSRIMSMVEFNTERCCNCARREDCKIYMHATGLVNEEG